MVRHTPSQPCYRSVIFDLDGTLLDTLQDLGNAVDFVLRQNGFPTHSIDEYRDMVGHGIRNLVATALPEDRRGDELFVDQCLSVFLRFYTDHIHDFTHPYPGMQDLLASLARDGISLAVASNKFQAGAETLIRKFFPDIRFAAVLGERPGFPKKPDPAIVEAVLSITGTGRSETVLVGDSGTDMKTAANGGIKSIAVSWGYRALAPSAEYALAHSAVELRNLLYNIQ